MKIPCDDCPVLAICRHREHVECDKVWDLFWGTKDEESHMHTFCELNTVLPNLLSLQKKGFNVVLSKEQPHYTFKEDK